MSKRVGVKAVRRILAKFNKDKLLEVCRQLREEGGGFTEPAKGLILSLLESKTDEKIDSRDESLFSAIVLAGVAKLTEANDFLLKVVNQVGEGDLGHRLYAANYLSQMGVRDGKVDGCVEELMGMGHDEWMAQIL